MSVIHIPAKGGAVVISGPSGVGKSTIINNIERESGIKFSFSVSATTREKRKGEEDGVDYYFFSQAKFTKYILERKFVEYAEVHGNFYGTLLCEVLAPIKNNEQVLLDIDVKGHALLREQEVLEGKILSIFLKPESLEDLERRLRDRNDGMPEEEIQARTAEASVEMARAHEYDFQILCRQSKSGIDEECLSKVCAILKEYILVRG